MMLPDTVKANVTALGMLNGVYCWRGDTVWLKDFAVTVQVNVDAIFGHVHSVKPLIEHLCLLIIDRCVGIYGYV